MKSPWSAFPKINKATITKQSFSNEAVKASPYVDKEVVEGYLAGRVRFYEVISPTGASTQFLVLEGGKHGAA